MKKLKERMMKEYPNVEKYDKMLFEDYMHHRLIMEQIAKKLSVPIDELMQFFYKGYIKKDLIDREEREYVRQSNNTVREVSKDNGCE